MSVLRQFHLHYPFIIGIYGLICSHCMIRIWIDVSKVFSHLYSSSLFEELICRQIYNHSALLKEMGFRVIRINTDLTFRGVSSLPNQVVILNASNGPLKYFLTICHERAHLTIPCGQIACIGEVIATLYEKLALMGIICSYFWLRLDRSDGAKTCTDRSDLFD